MPFAQSEFLTWFTEQHGPRTSGLLTDRTDDEIRGLIQVGNIATAQLEARKLWDEKHQSALYAWQARDKA